MLWLWRVSGAQRLTGLCYYFAIGAEGLAITGFWRFLLAVLDSGHLYGRSHESNTIDRCRSLFAGSRVGHERRRNTQENIRHGWKCNGGAPKRRSA
jgi:hypothetical protein